MTQAHGPGERSSGGRVRILDPVSRATEILFGLIMVLTFTASLNAATAGPAEVRLMLVAALGCNLAWGLIDAAMYLISARAEQAMARRTLAAVREARSPEAARREVAAALPPVVADALGEPELERVRQHLLSLDPPERWRLRREDVSAAGAVFLIVFLATLPVALPFLLIDDPRVALRASHGVAVASMFLAGCSLGRQWGRPWRTGLAMVAVGLVMVGIALVLGG